MKKHFHPAIYIPFEHYQSLGGPATFMRNLQRYLDQHNYLYLPSWKKDAKVVFFPTSFHLPKVEQIKRQGGYILQRLDGIYYPSKHGEEYRELNRDIEKIYLDYADTVIFQSGYSQAQCFAMFGERDEYQIIINGVDKSLFYPDHEKRKLTEGKIQFVTTGRFRNIDMIEPVMKALDMLNDTINFELTAIGPVVNPQLEPYFQRAYIRHIETLSFQEIAEVLRASDIFLYSHLNPPCPNSVIEAISCGLPVVGFDSGAMTELCFFSKDLLAYVSDEVFQKYEDFDAHKFAEKIMKAVQDYNHYRNIALAHSHLYSFEECGKQYMDMFQCYLNKRRKLLPYITFHLRQGMKKLRRLPNSIKYRLMQ